MSMHPAMGMGVRAPTDPAWMRFPQMASGPSPSSHSQDSRDGGPAALHIDINEVASGNDSRTTIMIRNVPNKYTQAGLLKEVC